MTFRQCSFGVAVAAAGLCSMLTTAFAAGPSSLIPSAPMAGWKQIGAVSTYDRNTLYKLVDGEAEAITSYAFTSEAHAEYGPAKSIRPTLTLDVFDVTNPLNAFGLFGSDRSSGTSINIGAEAVRIGASALNFWKANYVVRITIVDRTPTAPDQAAMLALARLVAGRIHGAGTRPASVLALPPGYQPRSEGYSYDKVAGLSFVRNAVGARYPTAGIGCALYIAQYPSAKAAQGGLAAYKQHEATGVGLKAVPGLGQSAFQVVDRYAKNVVVAQKGPYLIFVLRAKSPQLALGLVKQAVSRVH